MRASQCRIWTAANTLPHKAGDDFTVKSHRLSNNGQSAILIEDEKRAETVIPDGVGGCRCHLVSKTRTTLPGAYCAIPKPVGTINLPSSGTAAVGPPMDPPLASPPPTVVTDCVMS